MKNSIFGAVALMFTAACSPAHAEEINDHYKNIVKRIPYNEQVCNWIDVPIYGNASKEMDTQGAIIGGIIGGLIGNQVGKGGGKNAATGIGALSGAIIGGKNNNNNSQSIIGYRQERQCQEYTRYNEVSENVYSHSTVTFDSNGKTYTLRFKR